MSSPGFTIGDYRSYRRWHYRSYRRGAIGLSDTIGHYRSTIGVHYRTIGPGLKRAQPRTGARPMSKAWKLDGADEGGAGESGVDESASHCVKGLVHTDHCLSIVSLPRLCTILCLTLFL